MQEAGGSRLPFAEGYAVLLSYSDWSWHLLVPGQTGAEFAHCLSGEPASTVARKSDAAAETCACMVVAELG